MIRLLPVSICVIGLVLVASPASVAQTVTVTGSVVDSVSRRPLQGVIITLSSSGTKRSVAADARGEFSLDVPTPGLYTLSASRVGYRDLERVITLRGSSVQLGILALIQQPVELPGIDVVSELQPVEQHRDTVQFNAGAYKSNPDATAEDLLKKLPGVTTDNNSVKAQGETVQQVLVDGRPFFGDDPFVALRNLPADVIDKIQVYDKLSDQAQLTGFDDGQSSKTINIITRTNRRNSRFGRLLGGYGDDRYQAGGNANFFGGDRRLSAVALSNNVNQQNFSAQDLLGVQGGTPPWRGGFGAGMRGGGGGGGRGGDFGGGGGQFRQGGPGFAPAAYGQNGGNFLIGQQDGINTVNSVGLNYSDVPVTGLEASGSYFFNATRNVNDQITDRQYGLGGSTDQQYHETSDGVSTNYNHRINLRMEYTVDSSNALIFVPRISFQSNNASGGVNGVNSLGTGALLNETASSASVTTTGYNSFDMLTYRHKFDTPGRTFSVNLSSTLNGKSATSDLSARTAFYADTLQTIDTTSQQSKLSSPGYTLSTNVAYTEPLGTNNLLQWNYSVSVTNNRTDKRVYTANPVSGAFDVQDDSLSNVLTNGYRTQRAGMGYRGRGSNVSIIADVGYQRADLSADYTLPMDLAGSKSFESVLPLAILIWRPTQTSNVRMMYRTSTTAPSISQLQSVVDNSNPTQLTAGNPDLRQTYTHSLTARYSLTNPTSYNTFFALVSGTVSRDYIANATYLFPTDTTLRSGIPLAKGTQFTQPVNLNGYQNFNTLLTDGFPVEFIRTNINVNAGLMYSRTPSYTNDLLNFARTYAFSQGVVFASNVSPDVDFTLSYNAAENVVRNSTQPQLDTRYFQHTANAKLNFIVWNGIVLRNDLTQQLYLSPAGSYNQHYVLWNAGLGKKFLQNQSLEVALSAFDLLNQNAKVTRNVTPSYVEDVRPQVLTRYFMLTATYTFRAFSI